MDPRRYNICPVCGQEFSRRGNLTRHMRCSHNASSPSTIVEIPAEEDTITRPLVVPVIATAAAADADTTHHVFPSPRATAGTSARGENVETSSTMDRSDSPPHTQPRAHAQFQCPGCSRSFTSRFSLQRHRRFHCAVVRERSFRPPPSPPPSPPSTTRGAGHPPSPSSSSSVHGSSTSGEDEPQELPRDLAPEGFEEFETAFRGRLKTFRLVNEAPSDVTIPEFLVTTFDRISPKRDITNFLLVGSVVGTGLYIANTKLVKSAPKQKQVMYSACGSLLFTFGSVLLWAVLRNILPDNKLLAVTAGVVSGVTLTAVTKEYLEFVDSKLK